MTRASVAIAAVMLLACADDVCPASVEGTALWSATSSEAECVELARTLNDEALQVGSGGGQGCDGGLALAAQGGQCGGELHTSCEGVKLDASCDVLSDTSADCEARVQVEGLNCSFELRVR